MVGIPEGGALAVLLALPPHLVSFLRFPPVPGPHRRLRMPGAVVPGPVPGVSPLLLALLPDPSPLTAVEPPLLAVLPRAPLLILAAIAAVHRKEIHRQILLRILINAAYRKLRTYFL